MSGLLMLTHVQRGLIRSLRYHTTLGLDEITDIFAKITKTSRSRIAEELAEYGRPKVKKKKSASKLVTGPDGKRTYQTATTPTSVIVQVIGDKTGEVYVYGWHRTGGYFAFFQKLGARKFDHRHLTKKVAALKVDFIEIPSERKHTKLEMIPMGDPNQIEKVFRRYAEWAMPDLSKNPSDPIKNITDSTIYRRKQREDDDE